MLDARDRLQIPSGVEDLLLGEAERLRAVREALIAVVRRFGYREVVTPTFEFEDVFSRGLGSDMNLRTYRLVDRDGQLLSLRSDITPSVVRAAATRLRGEALPLRLFYAGRVFRYDQPHAGKTREMHQVGVEHLGGSHDVGDLEMVILATEGLRALGLESFRLVVGHAGVLGGVIQDVRLDLRDIETLRRWIAARDRTGIAGFVSARDIPKPVAGALALLPGLCGDRSVLLEARARLGATRALAAVEELLSLSDRLGDLGLTDKVIFDLGEVKEMNYYTGLVLRLFVEGAGSEVGSGGRYDGLPAQFGADWPATGFCWDAGRLARLVSQRVEEPPVSVSVQDGLARAFGQALDHHREGRAAQVDGGPA